MTSWPFSLKTLRLKYSTSQRPVVSPHTRNPVFLRFLLLDFPGIELFKGIFEAIGTAYWYRVDFLNIHRFRF